MSTKYHAVGTCKAHHFATILPSSRAHAMTPVQCRLVLQDTAIGYPAPPTPTGVTAQFTNTSSVRVAWQWTSPGPALDCFNTTTVTYRPEGGSESFLQLSDPTATEATLTDLHCSTSYTISIHTSSGSTDTRSAPSTVSLPARGTVYRSKVFFFIPRAVYSTSHYCFPWLL